MPLRNGERASKLPRMHRGCADIADLPRLHDIIQGLESLLYRGCGIPTVNLVEIDIVRAKTAQTGIGPLALLSRVRNIDEAIEKANSVPYGLAAYAFTNSARNVDRLAEGVEVGNLSINHFVASSAETPFGGVKDSGFGREGDTEGLQCYTVVKNVSHLTA